MHDIETSHASAGGGCGLSSAMSRKISWTRCCEPAMLEEGVSDHRHKRMTVKALPGSSLEVVKTEFFFNLLVSLLANPTRLDGGCQGAQVGLRRQIGSSLPTSCVRR